MDLLMWMLNLFSLFSSFGALVMLMMLVIREPKTRTVSLRLFILVLTIVFTYGLGIVVLLGRSGLEVPDTESISFFPDKMSWPFVASLLLYTVQFWLAPSIAHHCLKIYRTRATGILAILYTAGLLVPGVIFGIDPVFILNHKNLFSIILLTSYQTSFIYSVLRIYFERKKLVGRFRNALGILLLFTGAFLLPMMFLEDLLMLLGLIPPYNLFEAVTFMVTMTSILVMGITYMTTAGKRSFTSVAWLDVAREYELTEREMDVLKELLLGRSYKEIAVNLTISTDTVKTHVSRIYRKCGVSAKQELKYKIRDFSET